jgi:hypothetical protein
MQSKDSLFDAECDIDWSQAFTWVHDYGRLRPLEQSAEDGRSAYQKTDGTVVFLTDEERDGLYHIGTNDQEYKRRYKPAQAHCLARPVEVDLHGKRVRLEPGDAILRYGAGTFEIVPASEYRKNYLAIAFERTAEPPPYPFPDESRWQGW